MEGTFLQAPSRLGVPGGQSRAGRQCVLAFTQAHPSHCPDRLHLQQGITHSNFLVAKYSRTYGCTVHEIENAVTIFFSFAACRGA